MSTLDRETHRFTCKNCHATEETVVYQKGSSWGASWTKPGELKYFSVLWTRGTVGEPSPKDILCIGCGCIGLHELS